MSNTQLRALLSAWREKGHEQKRRWIRRFKGRVLARITPDKLDSALREIHMDPSGVLLVHSSFGECGYFTGGPGSVLETLSKHCGTLCLPTHTYCYPEDTNSTAPLFDFRTSPSKNGILTETFRGRSGVIRSIHSTHSLAASGPLAGEICKEHYKCDTPCGPGTPYATLVALRASVLLFGINFHSYTLFHTAEDASGSEYAYQPGTLDQLRFVDERGKQRDSFSRRQSRTPRRFAEAGDLLESVGLVRRVELGQGALLFVPDCSKVHDFLVERLRVTPDYLNHNCTKGLQD
jgi:aminoglycoside 3-N-acetyltransferase